LGQAGEAFFQHRPGHPEGAEADPHAKAPFAEVAGTFALHACVGPDKHSAARPAPVQGRPPHHTRPDCPHRPLPPHIAAPPSPTPPGLPSTPSPHVLSPPLPLLPYWPCSSPPALAATATRDSAKPESAHAQALYFLPGFLGAATTSWCQGPASAALSSSWSILN